MSHFTQIRTRFSNTQLLEQTLQDLQLKYTKEFETSINPAYVEKNHRLIIKQTSNSPISFKWSGSEYELLLDQIFWAQPYSIEKFLNQIQQRYVLNSVLHVSENNNFQLQQTKLNNGTIQILLRKSIF